MFANESHYTGCQLDFDESPAEPIKLGSLRKSLNEFPNTTKPQTSNNGELVLVFIIFMFILLYFLKAFNS